MPTSAARIMELNAAGEIDLEAYASVIRMDSGLAASVVRVVNSPALGLDHPVQSIREACFCLGINALQSIVSGCAVMAQFPPDAQGQRRFDRYAFWEHCAATAILSAAIADEVGADSEAAFTAGLLHDIGRVVLDIHFPRQFRAILLYRDRHDVWIRDAEAGVLGFDHCVVGERVAERWGLPRPIIEAIAHHHQPEISGLEYVHAAIVHVADILARGMQVGNPGDHAMPLLSESALRQLGLNWPRLRLCLEQAEGRLADVGALVGDMVGNAQASGPGVAESH
nr:HDOD domain-containing protein [Natronocella acetinitrilica]